jgi:Tol biopolymer transport system component
MRWKARLRPIPRLVPILLLIGLLLAASVAFYVAGSQRRLPPPFGLATPGLVAFVADGDIWTANPDGSDRLQLTLDERSDSFPVFSRDGTKIAFKRLPAPNSKLDWQDWGDVMVADADGRNEIVLDAMVRSPSPMTWSPDGRFIVYSRTVDSVDQVFTAATDGSSTHQITSGPRDSWGPTVSPDGRTIAFVRGFPEIVGIYVVQSDGTGEGLLTSARIDRFDLAEWSPDAMTVVFGAGVVDEDHDDLWAVTLVGKPERRIVGSPGDDSGPTWSPDGQWIAYLNTPVRGGRSRVMVAGRDGSNKHQISDPGDWSYPQWSPDAQHVLAVDGRLGGGQPTAMILDPLGRSPPSSFALPGGAGDGFRDFPAWQRKAQ